MANLMKRTSVIIFAAILCVITLAGTAFAYFTDAKEASGSHTLQLGYSTELVEGFDTDGNKQIVMTNTGETEVYVRTLIYYGTEVGQDIEVDIPGAENWEKQGDNTWFYNQPLKPGEYTSVLPVTITTGEGVNLENFDVIVIGQTTRALYDSNNDPYPADWQN